jgi:hypothetical protein
MRLRINIYTAIAWTMPIIMIALNLFPSWSKYAKSNLEILLDATLISIGLIFYELANANSSKYDRYISWAFFGILLTDVTQSDLAIPHYIVTATGAILVAIRMVTYYHRESLLFFGNVIGATVGLLGFLVSIITDLYTVAIGEWIMASVAAIHVFVINNNLDHGR